MDTLSCRFHEEISRHFTPNNLHILRGIPKKPDKQDKEMGKKLPLNRTARNARVNTNCNPGRRPERREHLLDTGPVLSPIAKICNLEKRLTARRKSKTDRKGYGRSTTTFGNKNAKGPGYKRTFQPFCCISEGWWFRFRFSEQR